MRAVIHESVHQFFTTKLYFVRNICAKLRIEGYNRSYLLRYKMKLVMSICRRLLVLHHGELIAEGTPEDIRANDQVRRVYLGQGG